MTAQATTIIPAALTYQDIDHAMEDPPASLPSTVDETLSRCPRFRILVVGNTGVGKSSLIANIFNVSPKDIDIADDRAGTANIDREYTSADNPRFALHDSRGFEPGSTNHWMNIEKFISQRSRTSLSVEQRLHALWLCIEAPRSGARLMQTADEELLKLAVTRKIPVIVVFTKIDLLYLQFYAKRAWNQGHQGNDNIDQEQAAKDAWGSLRTSIEVFRQQFDLPRRSRFSWTQHKQPLSYVGVSTSQEFPGFLQTLKDLTEVTRKRLQTQETFIPWAVAQRIDPKQKIMTSIEEGHKKYWKNMAKSTVFRGHILKDCMWRIHSDIIKVWNFRDPEKLLTGKNFHVQMLQIIGSFVPQAQSKLHLSGYLPHAIALVAIFGPIFPPLAIAFGAAGLTAVAIDVLYSKYRAAPETALYLEAYIVYLTLFLHELFVATLQREWQKPLNAQIIMETLDHFRNTQSGQIHELVRSNAPSAWDSLSSDRIRQTIGDLICQQLGMGKD